MVDSSVLRELKRDHRRSDRPVRQRRSVSPIVQELRRDYKEGRNGSKAFRDVGPAPDFFRSTFLNSFKDSKEYFAVFNGRLYTVHKTDDNYEGNSLCVLGRNYALEESEKVYDLENLFIDEHEDDLDGYVSGLVNLNYLEEIGELNSSIRDAGNYLSRYREANLQRLVMVNVFDEFFKRESSEEAPNVPETDISAPEVNISVENFKSRDNSIRRLFSKDGLLVMEGKCYSLSRNERVGEEAKVHVIFNGERFNLRYFSYLDDFIGKYADSLAKRVKGKIVDHSSDYIEAINSLKERKDYLETRGREERIARRSRGNEGNLSFIRRGDNDFELKLTIPPFIIDKDGQYYFFGESIVGMDLISRGDRVSFSEPKVINMPYVHPFVYGSGDICFGGLSWSSKGVSFNTGYDIRRDSRLAARISTSLREAKRVLERGYNRNLRNPVRSIRSCDVLVASNRSGAEREARQRGVSLDRIIENR